MSAYTNQSCGFLRSCTKLWWSPFRCDVASLPFSMWARSFWSATNTLTDRLVVDLSFWDHAWFVGVQIHGICWPYSIQDLPYLVCRSFKYAPRRDDKWRCYTQYNLNGAVKKSRHPNRSRVLRMKSSCADAVSIFFLNDNAPCTILVDLSGRQPGWPGVRWDE